MDLLRWPVVGPFLHWRHARTTLQLVFLLVAVVVVVHGLTGPDLAATNVATVFTWVHYRGLLVVALLAAGNIFCAGCPFVRVRDWGRRLRAPTVSWPAWLRGKWIALALFALVLFAYERYDLWALPAATAWLVLAYFAGAFAIDLVFKGATFCKHLCPVGQFNFVASTVSPLELRIRQPATCDACRTADCVAGRRVSPGSATVVQRGCELGLFLPAKVGNLDCTFCLDCVQACPHDNIAIASRVPAAELVETGRRSAIGRLADRTDIVALVLLFVFGALLNAFAMTRSGHVVQTWLSDVAAGPSRTATLAVLFLLGLVVMPLGLVTAAAAVTRVLADVTVSLRQIVGRFAFALVPLGFGVWTAHYGFHLLTGLLVIVPVTQSAAIDLFGSPVAGEPLWRLGGLRPGAVFPIQLGCVLLGALGSLAVVLEMARRDFGRASLRAALPWIGLVSVLAGIAVWIFVQPMEMRGVGP